MSSPRQTRNCDLSFSFWALRISKGMTQEELARKLGTTRQTVGNWENGEKQPTMGSLKKICKGLKVPVAVCVKLGELRRVA